MNQSQADNGRSAEEKGRAPLKISYKEITWRYLEKANKQPDSWFEVPDYLDTICQELDYDPEQVLSRRVGRELTKLEGTLLQAKKQPGANPKAYSYADERETYRGEEEFPDGLKEKIRKILEASDKRLGPLNIWNEDGIEEHPIAIKHALDRLAEEGGARKRGIMYVTAPEGEGKVGQDSGSESNQSYLKGDKVVSQELKEIASQLDEKELPEDILQVDSRFFRGLGSIKRHEVDGNYVKNNIETYRGAEDHQRGVMMEIAGELIGLASDPVLDEEETAEIEQLLDDNFPRQRVSELKARLEKGFS